MGEVRHTAPIGVMDLLERTHELAVLRDRLTQVARSGAGHLVLVSGEAGVGKTALLRRFRDDPGSPARMLWAACDPLFTPRPLGPLFDIARDTGGELDALVVEGAKPHDVAASLLRALDELGPAVVILEDLHWADEATLDVVRLVGRRAESVPALVIGTYRPEQVARAHPLRIVIGELGSGTPVTRVGLTGLSREAVAVLAQGSRLDGDELHAQTGGNPFFVTEAVAADAERVPATVSDAVLARVAVLTAPARALLDAVAVVPQRADFALLQALAEDGLDALDECLGAGILTTEGGGVGFRHELARRAVEESLASHHAAALHRRAIGALSQPSAGVPDLARLAHHAEAAGDAETVLRFAPDAARHAASLGAHREAQNQYARALRFADPLSPEVRADLLQSFADESFLTDMRAPALEALAEALAIHRSRGDTVRQGETQRRREGMLICMGRPAEGRVAGLDAVALLERSAGGRELALAYAGLS